MLIGYTLADAPTDSDLTIPATILDFLAKQDVPLNVESTQAYIRESSVFEPFIETCQSPVVALPDESLYLILTA